MKELPGPKTEHPFPLELPFILDESDFPKLLAQLRESEFRDTVSISVRYHTDESHKKKWHATLYAASDEVLTALAKRIASIMSEVWYGEDLTLRQEGIGGPNVKKAC